MEQEKQPGWTMSALLIVTAMAGVGMLGLPRALAHTGWMGLLLLAVCGLFAYITTGKYLRLLLATIDTESTDIIDYSVLGNEAFGLPGKIATHITQNVTLVGSSIIYLVVIGHMLHELIPAIPMQAFSTVAGILLCVFVCFVPSLGHVRWNAYFAVATTSVTVLLILGMLFISPVPEPELINFDHGGLAYTFAVFTYAFGGHSVHPSIFAVSRSISVWKQATLIAYPATILFLYLPVAAISYRVLGGNLVFADSILQSLGAVLPPSFTPLFAVAILTMTAHVAVALPILFIPVLQRFEASVIGPRCRTPQYTDVVIEVRDALEPLQDRAINCCTVNRAVRVVVTLIITALAVLLPYLTELVAIVACVSVACDVYIFPSLFFLQRMGFEASKKSKSLAWFIVMFGFVGAVAGLAQAIPALVARIAEDNRATDSSDDSLLDFGWNTYSYYSPGE